MKKQTIRDRFWLWGMKVNVLQQESERFAKLFGKSTITVEQAMQATGARNVIMAGGLEFDRESLDAMPSARRIICKWAFHRATADKDGMSVGVVDEQESMGLLMAAKELAAQDPRIEGFLVDDFSTGSIDAGVKPEHLARLQFANATRGPARPLNGTIYTMTVDRPELPALLPYFSQLLVPLWHADQIATVPAALDRLTEMTGGTPMMLCLYLYDFGNKKQMTRRLMQQHLDLSEELLLGSRISGLCICGTCMMDLDWESNPCLREWLERVGDRTIKGA